MLELHNRYLLLVEYGNANAAQHPTLDFQTSAAATLHEALLHLYKIPPDQFHPDAAMLGDHARFVKNAHILDLVDGKPVVSTLYEPHPSQPAYDGIHLVIAEGIPVSALKAQLGEFSNRTSLDHPAIFDFLQWDPDGLHMVPTSVFSQVFRAAVHMTIAGSAPLIPHAFALSLQGFQINPDADPNSPHYAPALTEHHHFETLDHAVIKQLLTPSWRFSYTQSREHGAPAFYDSARIAPIDPIADTPLASCYLQPPTSQGPAPLSGEAGRFLEFDPAVAALLQLLGIDPVHFISANGHQRLQLDQYPPEATSTLLPMAHLQGPIATLMKRYGQEGPRLAYEAIVSYRIALPGLSPDGHDKPSVEQILHTHTDDPLLALFQMLSQPIAAFDKSNADTMIAQITHATIMDEHKSVLLALTTQPPGPAGTAPGLYLGIAPPFLIHPAIAHLHPGQLTAAGQTFRQDGHLLCIPIALLQDGALRITAGYQGFSATALAHYFATQLAQRPDLQKFPAKTIGEDGAYLVTQTWLLDTGHPPRHFTIVKTCADPLQGLQQIARLTPDLFTYQPLAVHRIPMRLVSGNLVLRQQGTQQYLVRKFGHPLDDTRSQYSLHSRDPLVMAAFAEVFGAGQLGEAFAMAARLEHIERTLRPSPPGPSRGHGP